MKHPLEIENEDLQKRIEATYDLIRDVENKIMQYAIMDMAEQVIKNTQAKSYFMNTILANNQTFNDIIKWGNNK